MIEAWTQAWTGISKLKFRDRTLGRGRLHGANHWQLRPAKNFAPRMRRCRTLLLLGRAPDRKTPSEDSTRGTLRCSDTFTRRFLRRKNASAVPYSCTVETSHKEAMLFVNTTISYCSLAKVPTMSINGQSIAHNLGDLSCAAEHFYFQ